MLCHAPQTLGTAVRLNVDLRKGRVPCTGGCWCWEFQTKCHLRIPAILCCKCQWPWINVTNLFCSYKSSLSICPSLFWPSITYSFSLGTAALQLNERCFGKGPLLLFLCSSPWEFCGVSLYCWGDGTGDDAGVFGPGKACWDKHQCTLQKKNTITP